MDKTWEKKATDSLTVRSQRLLQCVVAANQEKEIPDFILAQALEKPCVSLIGSLAHAISAENALAYKKRSIGFCRTYVAEAKAILEATRLVGLLEVRYPLLLKQLDAIDQGLVQWQGSLTTMREL